MKDVTILTQNGVNVEKSLELFGDMEMYDATLGDFLEAVETKLKNLKQFKETADMPNFAIEVHSLKSDSRYLGFVALADLSYELELKSKANDLMYIYDNYNALINEANRIINLSKQYLGREVKENIIEDMVSIPKDETILVVDDSNLVANFIKTIFHEKYNVYIAEDGSKAIEYLNSEDANKIKCCLLDLNMPNVNGFEVLEYFKANNLFYKIPVSIITGNDDKESVERAFKYPIIDLLSKPFNERDVKRIIEKTISYYS
ncbi:MAG: response regulator [Tenericutes bacterium]|nr:response regulator [Mycoplasmatota bacterium]